MQETQEARVRSLGREDPLEKGMATHSSILAWRIPGTEEPDGLQSITHGSSKAKTDPQCEKVKRERPLPSSVVEKIFMNFSLINTSVTCSIGFYVELAPGWARRGGCLCQGA